MKNKKYILALFIIVAILSISAVSAADVDSSNMISADNNPELILEDVQDDVVGATIGSDSGDELILEESDVVPASDESSPKLEETSDDIIGDSLTVETPSFTAIQNVVSTSKEGDTIYLKNQTYYESGSEIVVGKSLTFIGNDTVLDANHKSSIFNIPEGVHSITFKNIKFTNGNGGVIYSRSGTQTS